MGLRMRARMARGLALAGLVAAGALGLPAGAAAQEQGSVLLSFGPDLGFGGRRAWREGVLTGEYRSASPALWGLRPVYSFAASRQGAVLLGAGLHGRLGLGPVALTPHFSLGLYQDGRGGFDARELVQFRSGVDLLVPLGPRMSVGLGYYHVSNAGITRRSADLDVVRLALSWRY